MAKMGRREYIRLIAETLCREYGETLREYGTDVKMAERVVDVLNDYLFFHPMDMSEKEFTEWQATWGNYEIEPGSGHCLNCGNLEYVDYPGEHDGICQSCHEMMTEEE